MRSADLGIASICGGVKLQSPIVIASGTWPLGGPLWERDKLKNVGAVCSKGLTLRAREGNQGTRIWETPSGLLNSIGLENPGIKSFTTDKLPVMTHSNVPILANVAVETLSDLEKSLDLLLSVRQDLAGVELNVSCPNVEGGGMAWGLDGESVLQVLQVARNVWEDPLWLKLTPQTKDLKGVLDAAEKGGADAVVVANTWLGMAVDVQEATPVFQRTFAGLSGPAIFPLALRMVWETVGLTGLPVVGCGGVSGPEDTLAMLMAGASAVEVGTSMFMDLDMPSVISGGISDYMVQHGYESIDDLVGLARR